MSTFETEATRVLHGGVVYHPHFWVGHGEPPVGYAAAAAYAEANLHVNLDGPGTNGQTSFVGSPVAPPTPIYPSGPNGSWGGGPSGGLWHWLAFAAVLLALLVAADWIWNSWPFGGHSSASPQGTRVVTIQDFTKSRGIDTRRPLHARYALQANGSYAVWVRRGTDQWVGLHLQPTTQVVIAKNGGFKAAMATLTYNYRPLYTVPVHVKIGDSYTTPRFNDPFGPHSGGGAISQLIAGYNEKPAGWLASEDLRVVTIRTP